MKTSKIRFKRMMSGIALIIIALMLYLPVGTVAEVVENDEPLYVYQWNGNGKNSIDCEKAGEGERPDDGSGWIHWVFATKGDSTNASLTLEGSGSGTYSPGEPFDANVWHFYTPYFDVFELTASVTLEGGDKGPGIGLVISDYCPGSEVVLPMLTVRKELQNPDEEIFAESDLEFEFVISGGVFGEGETFPFSVDEVKEFGPDDGLEFGIEYSITEVAHEDYEFVSISQEMITLSAENSVVTVTIVNRELEDEEDTGTIVIEKTVKAEVDDEEFIPSNKTFTFNIYDHETDSLVREEVELEVVDGAGSLVVDELPLGTYRVEELAGSGYDVTMNPEDGIVNLATAEDNTVTVQVTNTPRPILIIEKVLLDLNGEPVADSNVQFSAQLDGGVFEEEEITFSVNDPAVLELADGLEFDVPYTVAEAGLTGYIFISIDPEEAFTLTGENNEVVVTIVNQVLEVPPVPPQTPPDPPVVFFTPPEEPLTSPEEEQGEVLAEAIVVEAEEPETEPEDEEVIIEPEEPQTEPEAEELVVSPEEPLTTPQTGGASLIFAALGLTLIGSGLLLKENKIK